MHSVVFVIAPTWVQRDRSEPSFMGMRLTWDDGLKDFFRP
jgi:hypothetical protein